MIITKKLTLQLLTSIILGLLLASPPLTADTVSYFKDMGHIYDLNSHSISLDDGYYRYSGTVKVLDLKGNPISTNKLKKGDYVELTIQIMDNKLRVDTIKRLPEPNIGAN